MSSTNPADNCFVCGITVELHLDSIIDGSPYYREVDENNHVFCDRDREASRQAARSVLRWSSSEDRDLRIDNAAAAGMRTGFDMLADPVREFLNRELVGISLECPWCGIDLSGKDEQNPDNHLTNCPWARMKRVIIGRPIESGVEPLGSRDA